MNAPTRPQLVVVNGHATTTSNQIAEHFGKRHDTVLRAIRNLECSPEYHARNFAEMVVEVEIGSGATRKDPAYTITRDGFVFLAMGFTGKEVAQWKEAYIEAFNDMEAALKAQAATDQDCIAPFLKHGISCATDTAYQSIVLAGNMIVTASMKDATYAARVAFYTAAMSLLKGAIEALKQERARLCLILEKTDGSAIGNPNNWPEAESIMNLVSAVPAIKPIKMTQRIAEKGGAA